MRRFFPCPISRNLCLSFSAYNNSVRFLTTSERDELSRVVSSVQSEAKGQSVDLSDMADATRNALKQIQETSKAVNFDEPRMKAKVQTLQTALKAYSGRLNNIQNEAKSLQADAEKVLKLVFGNDASAASSSASSSKSSATQEATTTVEIEDDFNVEPPMTAQKLEKMNEMPPGSTFSGDASSASQQARPAAPDNTVSEDEIVIETVEDENTSSNNNNNSSSSSSGAEEDSMNAIRAEETPIAEITSILHTNGIDFSDCRDAKSLRQRYKDYLDGKYEKKTTPQQPQYQTQQPNTPPSGSGSSSSSSYGSNYSQQYQNQTYSNIPPGQAQPHPSYQQQTPNTTETGIAHDPHPGAVRKQIDTQRYVRDVKEEIARENGVQASQIDLWSGMVKLEDHKRLYEYPNLQVNPIEVRQKGDMPRR